ncbi:uncharacterized protein LOC141910199 [Tubulanus polymorphus]|uniref:uncharacterized protein LOC141910199 n=1 Tax=Tubulanus polymorphus TaxID=672921 RepID=UPI003DA43DEC
MRILFRFAVLVVCFLLVTCVPDSGINKRQTFDERIFEILDSANTRNDEDNAAVEESTMNEKYKTANDREYNEMIKNVIDGYKNPSATDDNGSGGGDVTTSDDVTTHPPNYRDECIPEEIPKTACLNGGKCFAIQLGSARVLGCHCPEGFTGNRCQEYQIIFPDWSKMS